MPDWIKVYHGLPYFLRVLAASARGYYLNWWRYSRDTDCLIEEILDRETWSPSRWQSWQDERIAYMLHLAATRVPYYRRQWVERRRRGDRSSWEILGNWPILQKESLRAAPHGFIPDGRSRRRLFRDQTSGTTGKPVEIWSSRPALLVWYALHEARIRKWNGLERGDHWAIMGGQMVAPFHQSKPPFWVWNQAFRQLYLSSYHLRPDFIPAYVDAMKEYDVTYLLGYPSAMYSLSRGILEKGLTAPPLRVAVSNAEPLLRHQREVIERVFRCVTRDTYGMSEMVASASECEAGKLHLWPDAGYVEIAEENSPALMQGDEIGRIICTGLVNDAMPLIRYSVGDRGSIRTQRGAVCGCGRTLPVLQSVEGRLDDVIVTPDGRRIGRLDPVFKADIPIREAQVVQETLDIIKIRYVPAAGFNPSHANVLVEKLRERVGDVTVHLEEVKSLSRTANGKLRAVISHVK